MSLRFHSNIDYVLYPFELGLNNSFSLFLVTLKDLRSEIVPEGRGTLELDCVQRSSERDHGISSDGQQTKTKLLKAMPVLCVLAFLFVSGGSRLTNRIIHDKLRTQLAGNTYGFQTVLKQYFVDDG